MAGTRRRCEALVADDDSVAFLPAHDPSGVMPDPRVTTSTRSTTTTVAEEKPAHGGLSLIQLSGGALAAVTAAVAASFFGVAGTLTGAAVGSVISTIAAALYSNSLSRAARVSRTLVVRQTLAPAAPRPQPEVAEPPGEPRPEPHPVQDSVWQRINWKPVLLVAAGLFVAAMAVISVSELVLGHPIANTSGSGTTLSNLGGSSSQNTNTPTPTSTDTPTPSSSATETPTPSASGAARDASPNPSVTSPSTAGTTVPGTTAPNTAPTTAPTTASSTAPTGGGSSTTGG
jgi:hypothetical protein